MPLPNVKPHILKFIEHLRKKYCRYGILVIAVLLSIPAVLFTSCSKTPEQESNWFYFSNGETIGYNTTQFFMRIYSDTQWEITVAYSDPGDEWCRPDKTSGQNDATISVSADINDGTNRWAVFTVDFNGYKRSMTLTQLGANDGSYDDDFIGEWNELPYFDRNDTGSGLMVVTHYVPDSNGKRNYTVCYDTGNLYPVWVAYPMHASYYPGGTRTDAWAYDPKIPENLQPYLFRGIGGNRYDRGHMLPSASRTISDEANAQTFFFSNIAMQRNGLNAYVWANLEARVRSWGGASSSSDTLYVVTGAVLRTVGGNETVNRVYSFNDPDRREMAVPNYFYKALVKRWANGSYRGIAFWFPHADANRNVQASDAISIRELEGRTGIDYFTNLEADIQENVENEVNPALWGL